MYRIPVLLLCCTSVVLVAQTPSDLTVTANGRPVTLHEFEGGSFGRFPVDRPAAVQIKAAFDIRWVDIRPLNSRVKATISEDHSTITFLVSAPVPLTIEFNGEWKKVLHLFADPPEKNAPSAVTPNVRYFGPGQHEVGIIELKDNETLYLAPGAWVKGAVRSVGTKNLTIRGRGVLDGTGLQQRANMIFLDKTEGARIEGITIFNSRTWTVHVKRSNGVRIDGIRIVNYSTGTDGIDLVSSSDVVVENTFVRANDDCVVVKTWDDIDVRNIRVRRSVFWNMPWGNAIEVGFELRAKEVADIRFEDIDILRVERGAAISIHQGDYADVHDIVFDDIRIEDARHKLFDFAVVYGRYGVDKPTSEAEWRKRYLRGVWDGVLKCPPAEAAECAKHRGRIRNVTVRNIAVVDGALPFSVIAGYDGHHAVDGVTFEHVTYNGRPLASAAELKLSTDFAQNIRFRP